MPTFEIFNWSHLILFSDQFCNRNLRAVPTFALLQLIQSGFSPSPSESKAVSSVREEEWTIRAQFFLFAKKAPLFSCFFFFFEGSSSLCDLTFLTHGTLQLAGTVNPYLVQKGIQTPWFYIRGIGPVAETWKGRIRYSVFCGRKQLLFVFKIRVRHLAEDHCLRLKDGDATLILGLFLIDLWI